MRAASDAVQHILPQALGERGGYVQQQPCEATRVSYADACRVIWCRSSSNQPGVDGTHTARQRPSSCERLHRVSDAHICAKRAADVALTAKSIQGPAPLYITTEKSYGQQAGHSPHIQHVCFVALSICRHAAWLRPEEPRERRAEGLRPRHIAVRCASEGARAAGPICGHRRYCSPSRCGRMSPCTLDDLAVLIRCSLAAGPQR